MVITGLSSLPKWPRWGKGCWRPRSLASAPEVLWSTSYFAAAHKILPFLESLWMWLVEAYLHHPHIHGLVFDKKTNKGFVWIFPLWECVIIATMTFLLEMRLILNSEGEPDKSVDNWPTEAKEKKVLVFDGDQGERELDLVVELGVYGYNLECTWRKR